MANKPPRNPTGSDSQASGPKTWTAGTLVYTSGGVLALFLLLIGGDFAWGMRDRSVGPMAQWYLNHLGVSNVFFGLLITSFPAALGLLLGPIISVKSDRFRSKRGRRLPFLLITTPIAAFGMLGLAATPILAESAHSYFSSPGFAEALGGTGAGVWLVAKLQDKLVVSLVCFGVFWAAFEFATIVGNAVFGGLINDVVPRGLLGRFYGLFRAVSLLDGIFFNYWVIGKVPEHFSLIMAVIAVFYGTAFMWVCLKVREGEYPPPPPGDPDVTGVLGSFFRGARGYFTECFGNPYYVSVFVLMMTASLCFAPINTFAIPYSRSLGISMETYGKFLALTYVISLSLSFFLGWLVDLFHPLRMSILALAGYAVVALWGSIWATTPEMFLTAWVLHGVLSGCYFTSAASLGQRLYPQSRFAQFSSAGGICGSLGSMTLSPLVGLAIDRTGGIYRYTFVAGFLLSLTALGAAVYVYSRFMKLGGPVGYVPPE